MIRTYICNYVWIYIDFPHVSYPCKPGLFLSPRAAFDDLVIIRMAHLIMNSVFSVYIYEVVM